VAACATPDPTVANLDPFVDMLPTGRQAPPTLTLTAPTETFADTDVTITVTGAGDSEPVYIGWSVGDGPSRCPRVAGGLCLDIPGPTYLLGVATADASGETTLDVRTPSTVVPGTAVALQALIIRGANGFASTASNSASIDVLDTILGCTDPGADNYDPTATIDDGTCEGADPVLPGYSGPAGPDLSLEGYTLCSGTSSASTNYTQFYTPCSGFTTVRFACSTNADAIPEYVSDPVEVAAADMLDSTCDDWPGGANSNHGSGRIISIDDSDPGCGNFNVSYDLYMDMVSPQWGCNGSHNTHNTGGRMWMFGEAGPSTVVEGCTNPAADNFDSDANVDDGSCSFSAGGPQVPGYTGIAGPDLSAQGLSLCGGTSSSSTSWTQFLGQCQGYDEIVFACSTNGDNVPEFTSSAFPTTGVNLLDQSCDNWSGAALSPHGSGMILSIDHTDPNCGNFNVSYDLYMDMVSPQWGCNGSHNTHGTGGRMWAFVR
jgi:hypothetical protein